MPSRVIDMCGSAHDDRGYLTTPMITTPTAMRAKVTQVRPHGRPHTGQSPARAVAKQESIQKYDSGDGNWDCISDEGLLVEELRWSPKRPKNETFRSTGLLFLFFETPSFLGIWRRFPEFLARTSSHCISFA